MKLKWAAAIAVVAVGLTGCESTNPGARLVNLAFTGSVSTPSEIDAKDDAQCRQYGAQAGTDMYTSCRLQLAQMRQQRRIENAREADEARLAAAASAQSAAALATPAPMAPMFPQPRNCTTTYFGLQAQTHCN